MKSYPLNIKTKIAVFKILKLDITEKKVYGFLAFKFRLLCVVFTISKKLTASFGTPPRKIIFSYHFLK